MIFIDSNIPMYLVGSSDPHRNEARRLMEALIDDKQRLVTDVEVFQEILHRYIATRRRDAIQPAFDALRRVVDEVYSIEERDVERAKLVTLGTERLSARGAVHIATMERHRVPRILSFDRGFDGYPGIQRIGP
jgi:predicted nucleic acid-binding protein